MTLDATFPRTAHEFFKRFNSEEACRDYWMQMRWPGGFVCPKCRPEDRTKNCGWRRRGCDQWICADCGADTSIRAGTVLHNSPKPWSQWFLAMFYVCESKQSVSALRLQRLLGFGSYGTALRWLRELRRVMTPTPGGQLGPIVEADETYMGGVQKHAKNGEGKPLVLGVAEETPTGIGRAYLRLVTSRRRKELCDVVKTCTMPGSKVKTDGLRAYDGLTGRSFLHDPRRTTKRGGQLRLESGHTKVMVHLPRVHLVFDKVKKVIDGAYQGNVSRRHLQLYLDEYVFRFNLRHLQPFTQMVAHLIGRATGRQCVPFWRSSGRASKGVPGRPGHGGARRLGKLLVGVAHHG